MWRGLSLAANARRSSRCAKCCGLVVDFGRFTSCRLIYISYVVVSWCTPRSSAAGCSQGTACQRLHVSWGRVCTREILVLMQCVAVTCFDHVGNTGDPCSNVTGSKHTQRTSRNKKFFVDPCSTTGRRGNHHKRPPRKTKRKNNLSQKETNRTALLPEMVKRITLSPSAKTLTESLPRSVKENRQVDPDTAKKFEEHDNVGLLELSDIDRLAQYKHFTTKQMLGTIDCSCGKLTVLNVSFKVFYSGCVER